MPYQKWIILDRDGVINADSDQFIKSPNEWQALPGSIEAIAKLSQAAYKIVIISNQSGIARALFSNEVLEAIHNKMLHAIQKKGGSVHKIYFCPHGPNDHCTCRKPLPGLFKQASLEGGFDLSTVFAVGDSIRDLEAALKAGAKPILVETGKGPRSLKQIEALPKTHHLHQVPRFKDLASFTEQMCLE